MLSATRRWLDEQVLARVRELVLPSLEREGPIAACIIDDTGFPKKGRLSVGVIRHSSTPEEMGSAVARVDNFGQKSDSSPCLSRRTRGGS